MKTCIIFNPRSGHAARVFPAVRAHAARHGFNLCLTGHPRHASELAARALADGCELIVAAGGDGTVNEVASVLVGTSAIFGLVPCGSGNALGRHLCIHGSTTRALQLLTTGVPRLIDSGLADGHPFFCVAGVGFEAEIANRFNRLTERGFSRYLRESVRALLSWTPQEFTVIHAADTERWRAFTLAVANTSQYGNQARIAPRARIDDGLLDVCALPPLSPWNVLPLTARLFAGTLHRGAGVKMRRGGRLVVERATPGPLHTDGEVHAAGTRIEFAVRPASLRIMAPAPTAAPSVPARPCG